MRIDSSLPLTNIYNPLSQPAGQNTVEDTASKELQPNHASSSASTEQSVNKPISIEANTIIDLGKLNGKPFKMRFLKEGGLEWSGGIVLRENVDDIIGNPRMELAQRATSAFTRGEHEQAQKIIGIINWLYGITRRGESVKTINRVLRDHGISQGDIENALKRLGVDASKPFTINGWSFTSINGQLSEISTNMQPIQTTPQADKEQNANKQISLLDDPDIQAYFGGTDAKPAKMTALIKSDYRWSDNIDLTFMPDETDKSSTEKQRRAARAVEAYSKTTQEWAERLLSSINSSTLIPVEDIQESSSTRLHNSKA